MVPELSVATTDRSGTTSGEREVPVALLGDAVGDAELPAMSGANESRDT